MVFYNGTQSAFDHDVLKLSDAFQDEPQGASLELVANVYNINAGHNFYSHKKGGTKRGGVYCGHRKLLFDYRQRKTVMHN